MAAWLHFFESGQVLGAAKDTLATDAFFKRCCAGESTYVTLKNVIVVDASEDKQYYEVKGDMYE